MSSMEDNETITVKFWNDKMVHYSHIMAGQEVTAYSLVTTFFQNKVELTTAERNGYTG